MTLYYCLSCHTPYSPDEQGENCPHCGRRTTDEEQRLLNTLINRACHNLGAQMPFHEVPVGLRNAILRVSATMILEHDPLLARIVEDY